MSYSYWTEEEVEILTKHYPIIDDAKKLVDMIPSKTWGKIRSKANVLGLIRTYTKNIRKSSLTEDFKELECRICKTDKEYPQNFSTAVKAGRKSTVVANKCNKCWNDLQTIEKYRKDYSIELSLENMFDSYTVAQWWKWTYNEQTPNGKLIRFIPRELQTEENIAKLGRYVINEVIGLKTKDEILLLSQKDMEKFKMSFSRTPFILGSPINLIRLSFPDLEFKNWEMKHSGNSFWKDYSNFLDAVRYYYYDIYQLKFKDISQSKVFSPIFIEEEFLKLFRAKKIHYNDISWQEIMKKIDKSIVVPISPKEAFDGTKLDSIQEKEVYEFIKLSSIGDSLINIPHNAQEYKFHDEVNNSNYIPDFIILGDKPTIIEYFGCYDDAKEIERYEGYKLKTKNKIKYFTKLEDYNFIALYPKDLKQNFKGLQEKINNI